MNYTQLKSAVLDFLNRSDDTSIPIDTFIDLTEARLNRLLRVRQMEKRVTATADTPFITLPEDFLEMRNVQVNSDQIIALQYMTPQEADRYKQNAPQGKPRFFSIVANRIEIMPSPDGEVIEMVYYSAIPHLSDESETNWLITQHPDVYLYGTLVQSASYLNEDNARWAVLAADAVAEIELEDERAQFHGTTPQMRGVTIG